MSFCTEVYLCDFAHLHSLCDGENAEMKALAVQKRHPQRFQQLHENWGESKPASELLSDIFAGKQPISGPGGTAHAYALRLILAEIGKTLVNAEFCPYRLSWLESLDEAAKSWGLKGWSFEDFLCFMPPLPMAHPDDLPGVYTVKPEKALDIYRQFSTLKLKHPDGDVVKAFKQAKVWFKTASEANQGLIFFTF
ncbi:MAG: hypothetical protein AB7I41_07550 [Candidatus Sericytochromatia bacterium]